MGFYTNKRIDRIMEVSMHTGAAMRSAEIIAKLQEHRADLDSCSCGKSCLEIASFLEEVLKDLYEQQKLDSEWWEK
jgi:hypothetical protein